MYSLVHNKWGGGFKAFEKLINGGGQNKQGVGGGWGQNIKEKRPK